MNTALLSKQPAYSLVYTVGDPSGRYPAAPLEARMYFYCRGTSFHGSRALQMQSAEARRHRTSILVFAPQNGRGFNLSFSRYQ